MTATTIRGLCTRADSFDGGRVSADFADGDVMITLVMTEARRSAIGLVVGQPVEVTVDCRPLGRQSRTHVTLEAIEPA